GRRHGRVPRLRAPARGGRVMDYQQIRYAVDAGVLTVTLNRPERLNAFTAHMMHELLDAFGRADADDAVRAIIVTGAGRAFCAGADLGSGGGTFDHSSGPAAQALEEHRDGGGLVALRVFPAEEALAAGLVSRVVAPEALLDTARGLAREIADNTSAMSVALCRQMLWRMLGADHPMEAHKVDSRAIYWMGASADAREGVQAFLEKRPARFTLQPSTDMPAFYTWWEERTFK